MKYQKLLNKLKDILSAKRQAQLEKYSSLKKVLKSLHINNKTLSQSIKELKNSLRYNSTNTSTHIHTQIYTPPTYPL